jgi:ribonucleoside-diphosphate reductase alpha chain
MVSHGEEGVTEIRLDGGAARAFEKLVRPALGVRLTDNARRVLEKRYLLKDDHGRVAETPEELFWRAATNVALAEHRFGADEKKISEAAEKFYRALASLEFLPNSPTLMNAGRRLGQCFACFVLPVADAIVDEKDEGIFDAVRSAAFIHQSGGGTGFSFSRLRPEGAVVSSTHGQASGPVSFMRVFNAATSAIHQGGFRRGANMGILRVDHPDILDFVNLKANPREMLNFNLSVAITEEFLRSVRGNLKHFVLDPQSGKKYVLRDKVRDAQGNLTGYGDREWTARELFDLIVLRAWESGEPGLVFIDRVNLYNPTPARGHIEATNPCGEQALLPWEACTLGSINLAKFVEPTGPLGSASSPESRIRWKALGETIALGVRFLDDVIEANAYPKPQIEEIVRAHRKIGLGVMGWADMLFLLGLRYDSEAALALGSTVMRFVKEEGWRASMDLARERGPFPAWSTSAWVSGHRYFKAPRPLRNALVTTVAPTGSISILAGCSAGIEPLYSVVFERQILNGERLLEVHPYFKEVAEREGFASPELFERLGQEGTCRQAEEIPPAWREIFVSAHDIPAEGHLRMQAAFQEHTDNGVSKTLNFPHDATAEDVRRAYERAVELGVKGVTVYRDRSRAVQPMALGSGGAQEPGQLDRELDQAVGRATQEGASPAKVASRLLEHAQALLDRSGPSSGGSEGCPDCGSPLRLEEACLRCPCGYSRC